MTTPTPNVVNMETAARLIREAKEAREARRKARNDLWNSQDEAALTPQFPGGIDDLEV
jgi:hypothetical protein